MSWARPIRVVGIGSPQGDDAVAWQVVGQLQSCIGDDVGVEFHRIDGGQRLLDLLDGQGSLLVIDALAKDSASGEILEFPWPDKRLEGLRPGSTHGLGPAAALALADTLGVLPAKVVVFGITAVDFESSHVVSEAVAAAARELVSRLRIELTEASHA